MSRRGSWGSRLSFYFVAIGAAFSLGNLWRFPQVVGQNGGGAFVFLYVLLTFLLGMPIMMAELMLGKITGKSSVQALQSFKTVKNNFWIKSASYLTVFMSLMILSYYAVVSGWVLHFVMRTNFESSQISWQTIKENGFLQILLTSVHLLFVGFIVARGLKDGIEKWLGYLMPAFIVLMIVLAIQSLSLDTASDALRFLFYPDFTKLNSTSLLQAIAHVFFTLSVGLGAMVTFGSYMRDELHIPTEAFRVTMLDCLMSLMAGVIIYPILFGADIQVGPEMLFETVPVLFARLKGGDWFLLAFYLFLYVAAVGASVSLLEVSVSNCIDTFKFSRKKSTVLCALSVLLLAFIPALSSSVFGHVKIFNLNLFQFYDTVVIVIGLPLIALISAWVVGWKVPEIAKQREFLEDSPKNTERLYSDWQFILRYLTPFILICAVVLAVKSLWA